MFTSILIKALAHILWKAKRWRDVQLVGRLAKTGKAKVVEENIEAGPSSNLRTTDETSGQRKEEEGHSLRFINKVSPSHESDTEGIQEAENL